jgi:flagellar biogenesis protein FliO
MELDELKQTWTEHARKLDRVLSLNLQGLKAAQLDKTRSALGRFKAFRVFEMLICILVLIPLGPYIADHFSVPTLAIPGLIFAASVLVAAIGNIRQLILLQQISYADPVTTIQRKLEEIKLHFLRTIRLMAFMLPLYMVYVVLGQNLFLGFDILAHSDVTFLWVNLVVSLAFIAPAIWVFRNLSLKNIGNPAIRTLVHGGGGKQMIAALEFLKALQEFQDEDKNGAAAR